MSSTTKASVAVAATALLSITTPFVQPPDCKTQWRTASTLSSLFDGTMQTTLVKVSEPASTCYPSGWDAVATESRLKFSPGVCPEGWTYNQMAENGSRAATTAFCCDKFVIRRVSVGGIPGRTDRLTFLAVALPTRPTQSAHASSTGAAGGGGTSAPRTTRSRRPGGP